MDNATGAGYETQGGSRVGVCPAPARAASPFGPAAQAQTLVLVQGQRPETATAVNSA